MPKNKMLANELDETEVLQSAMERRIKFSSFDHLSPDTQGRAT